MYELEAVLTQALGERLARSPTSCPPKGAVLDLIAMTGPGAQIDWDSAFLDMVAPVSLGVGLEGSRTHRAFQHLASMLPGTQLALLLEGLTTAVDEPSTYGGANAPDADAVHNPDGRDPDEHDVLVAGSGRARTSSVTEDPFVAVEMVAAWERLAAWAKAQSALAAARLAGFAELNPSWPVSAGEVAVASVAGEELAMRLGCSRAAARELISLGRGFEGALMPTGEAMLAGVIDLPKARVILKHLEDTPGQTAWGVQEVVLPGAGTRTPTQLAGDLRRALISIDPQEAESRRVRAVDKRRVCRPRALPDGMAGIWTVLPAPAAVQVDSALDGLARSLRAGGDSRTLDQLRADIFAHTLVLQELLDANPALKLLEAKPALTDRTLAGSNPDGQSMTGPTPLGLGLAEPVGSASLAGTRPAFDSKQSPRGRQRTRAPALINVTVSLSTLLGMDDEPGDLAGYGAITAHAARELAAGGVWRRIVTDPLTGSALDVGRARYIPPASLVEHIRVRDRVCARPGCSAPAASCDLDHTIEFTRADGTTSHTNLGPLCRRDHQIKTDGGFRLSQPEPGVFDWVTPAGHTYRVWPGDHGRYEITSRPPPGGGEIDGAVHGNSSGPDVGPENGPPESSEAPGPPEPHPWDGPPPF